MDTPAIKRIILLHFRRLRKSYNDIKDAARMEPIHDFRVEYKKLRAFLRLLSFSENQHRLKVPGHLKRVYKCGGTVRDLQLHITNLEGGEKELKMPSGHVHQLKKDLIIAKRNLKKTLSPEIIPETKKEIIDQVSGSLTVSVVEQFISYKSAEINDILSGRLLRDLDFHQVRKNLKDIIYNAKIITKQPGFHLPWKVWNTEKENSFNELADDLGNFQDIVNQSAFLKRIREKASESEKKLIAMSMTKLKDKKKQLKISLLRKFSGKEYF